MDCKCRQSLLFLMQKKFLAKEEEEVLGKSCACVYANSVKQKAKRKKFSVRVCN